MLNVVTDGRDQNGVSGFDYLGFSTGYGNVGDERTMQAGSYNYAYVVAVPQGVSVLFLAISSSTLSDC